MNHSLIEGYALSLGMAPERATQCADAFAPCVGESLSPYTWMNLFNDIKRWTPESVCGRIYGTMRWTAKPDVVPRHP